jgi:hypothetical protein
MSNNDLRDAGLAYQLRAITAEPIEAWDRAVAAWRYIGGDPADLVSQAIRGATAADIEDLATGTTAYALRQLHDAVQELGRTIQPRWLWRLVEAWSRRRK